MRARRSCAGREQPERSLAGLGVGDRVGDRAGPAGTLGVGDAGGQLLALRGPLEATVLVEELGIELEDPLADHVEAEVARLDDAGVDRPHGHLVHPPPLDRHGPARRLLAVLDQRPQRLVPRECHSAQVVGLALVPLGAGGEVDDRLDLAVRDRGPQHPGQRTVGEQRAPLAGSARAAGVGTAEAAAGAELVSAGLPPAGGLDRHHLHLLAGSLRRGAHAGTPVSASTIPESGSA